MSVHPVGVVWQLRRLLSGCWQLLRASPVSSSRCMWAQVQSAPSTVSSQGLALDSSFGRAQATTSSKAAQNQERLVCEPCPWIHMVGAIIVSQLVSSLHFCEWQLHWHWQWHPGGVGKVTQIGSWAPPLISKHCLAPVHASKTHLRAALEDKCIHILQTKLVQERWDFSCLRMASFWVSHTLAREKEQLLGYGDKCT